MRACAHVVCVTVCCARAIVCQSELATRQPGPMSASPSPAPLSRNTPKAGAELHALHTHSKQSVREERDGIMESANARAGITASHPPSPSVLGHHIGSTHLWRHEAGGQGRGREERCNSQRSRMRGRYLSISTLALGWAWAEGIHAQQRVRGMRRWRVGAHSRADASKHGDVSQAGKAQAGLDAVLL